MTWSLLPEPLFFSILSYFQYHEIIRIGNTCRRWQILSKDNLLWKKILCRDFQIDLKTKIHPSESFWINEYKRLVDDTPNVMSEEVCQDDEVWHVSFSNSGKFIATCSKDASVIVSNIKNDGTTSLRYREDMTRYGWQSVCFSKFNSDDSLLMVSGRLNGIKGEIAIFECTDFGDFVLLCKILNNPCEANGAWCDANTWLFARATRDPVQWNLQDSTVHMCRTYPGQTNNMDSEELFKNIPFKLKTHIFSNPNLRCFILSKRKHFTGDSYDDIVADSQPPPVENQQVDEQYKSVLQENKLCLIFLCGENTSVLHQVGFKRLYPNGLSSDPVASKADKLIEMQGQIVGITQDREERFLYVNVRRWPEGTAPSEYENVQPPAIADDIETRVIDLQDLSLTGQVYRGHKGYTEPEGAFFIFLDVGNTFVGSGSEDGCAFIWDKHYGCRLAANKHEDVVNSVAFSPTDSSVMVSASDDHKVKVWISRSRARSLQAEKYIVDFSL